jgi:hypothetical protein
VPNAVIEAARLFGHNEKWIDEAITLALFEYHRAMLRFDTPHTVERFSGPDHHGSFHAGFEWPKATRILKKLMPAA